MTSKMERSPLGEALSKCRSHCPAAEHRSTQKPREETLSGRTSLSLPAFPRDAHNNTMKRAMTKIRHAPIATSAVSHWLGVLDKSLHLSVKLGNFSHLNWKLCDTENGLVVAEGESGGGRLDWEFGISRYKLLYIGWINSNVLLYTQGTIFNILW